MEELRKLYNKVLATTHVSRTVLSEGGLRLNKCIL